METRQFPLNYHVEVLADTSYWHNSNGANNRLFTVAATYPRYVHEELLTHCSFARNAASSRAIPVAKMIENVLTRPVMPVEWCVNRPGMTAAEVADAETADKCVREWLGAMQNAVTSAKALADLGIHKQVTNRLLHPFQWITTIITGTNWANFFHLRCHKDAQPEMQVIANMICEKYFESESVPIDPAPKYGFDWHLPFVDSIEKQEIEKIDFSGLMQELGMDIPFTFRFQDVSVLISAARCARVSYLNHYKKIDYEADIRLAAKLAKSGHFSPFEHQAFGNPPADGKFPGWFTARACFPRNTVYRLMNSPAEYRNRERENV